MYFLPVLLCDPVMSTFQISDSIYSHLSNSTDSCLISQSEECETDQVQKYHSLLFSLITNIGVEFIGGILFFITAIYIVKDKLLCEAAASGKTVLFEH